MTCPREAEIHDALTTALWPEELIAHLPTCASCTDLVTVANAIHEDFAMTEAPVPSSGVMWWRIQRRERAEAARTAERTITFVQTAAVFGAIAIALTILGGGSIMSDTFHAWMSRLTFTISPQWSLLLLCALVSCVLLGPVIAYFTFAKE